MVTLLEELAEPSRRRLLTLLLDGPVSVSGLVRATDLKQPNVSNHLARLRSRGLVRASKVGRQVFYSLASPHIESSIRSVGLGAELPLPEELDLAHLASEFAKAAAEGDERVCGEILDRALRGGHTVLESFEDLLGGAMAIVGRRYLIGELDESGEHLASEITIRALARAAAHYGRKPHNDLVALLGCAPGARHVIGLRMIGDYLSSEGWHSIYLGADVPIPAFVATVRQNAPDIILLACHSASEVASTLTLIRELDRLHSDPSSPEGQGGSSFLIGVGGGIVAEDATPFRLAGADFTAPTLRSFARETLPAIHREIAAPKASSQTNRPGSVRTEPGRN